MRFDANHEISQTVSAGKLTEYHREELIPTGKVLNVLITQVFMRQTIKYTLWEKICKLRVNIFALIHGFELIKKQNHKYQFKCTRDQKALQARYIKDFKERFLIFIGHY